MNFEGREGTVSKNGRMVVMGRDDSTKGGNGMEGAKGMVSVNGKS